MCGASQSNQAQRARTERHGSIGRRHRTRGVPTRKMMHADERMRKTRACGQVHGGTRHGTRAFARGSWEDKELVNPAPR
eukprot:6185173-Pleurochrysis_carterae.AAC.1